MELVSVPYAGSNSVSGEIHIWNKTEGQWVAHGEVLVVIETEFAFYELNHVEGVVRCIHSFVGQSVRSGMIIGLVGDENEPLPDESIFSSLLPAPPLPRFVAWQWLPSFLRKPLEVLIHGHSSQR